MFILTHRYCFVQRKSTARWPLHVLLKKPPQHHCGLSAVGLALGLTILAVAGAADDSRDYLEQAERVF